VDAIDMALDPRLRAMRADAADWLRSNEGALERLGIVRFNRDTDGRPFINKSRLGMLHNGAIRLAFRKIAAQADQIREMERLIGALPAG
jgi:hypothetical protein